MGIVLEFTLHYRQTEEQAAYKIVYHGWQLEKDGRGGGGVRRPEVVQQRGLDSAFIFLNVFHLLPKWYIGLLRWYLRLTVLAVHAPASPL